jgi:cytoskeletal protein RodZ
MSVEDVSSRTKLRTAVIEAIESEDFGLCGGEAYVVGHLRMIAAAVGEDPEQIVSDYRRGAR